VIKNLTGKDFGKAEDFLKDLLQLLKAIETRNFLKLERIIDNLREDGWIDLEAARNLRKLAEGVTILQEELSPDEIIDAENLDRGFGWGEEPKFQYGKLYQYFDHLVEKDFIDKLKSSLWKNENFKRFLSAYQNEEEPSRESILESLKKFHLNKFWYAQEGKHPYVITLVKSPEILKKEGFSSFERFINYISEDKETLKQLSFDGVAGATLLEEDYPDFTRHKNEIARILMKSRWKELRTSWEPIQTSMKNLFYSNLLYIALHLRGTFCLYYLPSSYQEYKERPELVNLSKYKIELKDIVESQRILWYTYTLYNHTVDEMNRIISDKFNTLLSFIRQEKLPQVVSRLSEITTEIILAYILFAGLVSYRFWNWLSEKMHQSKMEKFKLG